jgi:hypothetical protein
MKNAAAPGRALEPPALPAIAAASGAVQPAGVDAEPLASLPRDHPAWQRDVLGVSSRVRSLLAGLEPVVVRVLGFWDHVVRGISIGERYVEVDPSGCYRLR